MTMTCLLFTVYHSDLKVIELLLGPIYTKMASAISIEATYCMWLRIHDQFAR